MTRTKDLFMEEREREQFDEMMNEVNDLQSNVPPIDIAFMVPSLQTSEQIANGIIEAIKTGQISPIEFAVKKKCILDAFELAFKDGHIKKMCVEEVEKHGKEGASLYGATIKVTSTAKYDYSKDPTWKELNDSIAPVQEKIKAQEEKIKIACKNNASLVDSETGEIIASIVPAPRTETVAVSFKKR